MKTKATSLLRLILLLPILSSGAEWIVDPSVPPPRKDIENSSTGNQYRIWADFNGDGVRDLALSDQGISGNAGREFTLYLGNTNGLYRKHGRFFAHPRAVALEKIDGVTRLWTYERGGGWLGQIGYHEVLKNGLSEFRSITIHPGDGGTPMGNAIYEAVFKNSDSPIILQERQTEEGNDKWQKAD